MTLRISDFGVNNALVLSECNFWSVDSWSMLDSCQVPCYVQLLDSLQESHDFSHCFMERWQSGAEAERGRQAVTPAWLDHQKSIVSQVLVTCAVQCLVYNAGSSMH